MNFHLLADWRLLFVVVLSAFVSLLGSLNIAARPAAVTTGRVALATTIASIFFMVTRLANMFYLPLMGGFSDSGTVAQFLQQIRWVILGSSAGLLLAWLLLANFISLYEYLVEQLDESGVRSLFRPAVWINSLRAFSRRAPIPARLGKLEGIPISFLLFNVFATSVWTVGALSAVYCSASMPEFKSTALLLSGLVNSFAAIAFSVWVDPQAALITDQCIDGKRPRAQVFSSAVHLAAGSFFGSLLGLLMLPLGIRLISEATRLLGDQGDDMVGSVWGLVLLNASLTMLASTTYASRVSAVVTRKVAMALAIYNLFFLVTRLSGQVYAPMLGSIADYQVKAHQLGQLESTFRQLLLGASVGSLAGLLLLPTFVEVINRAVIQLDRRGSIPAVVLRCLHPASWRSILTSLRPPGLLGVRLQHLRDPGFPRLFLAGNVLVLSIHTVGVMAAIYAGATLDGGAARAATLLSSVVNGVATITLSLLVDPTVARLTDQCVKERRDPRQIRTAAVFLMVGMLVGTLLSQLIFLPAAWIIRQGAIFVDWVM